MLSTSNPQSIRRIAIFFKGHTMSFRRGLNQTQALEYLGIKRRTFETVWRPLLVEIRQGVSILYDRTDLDRLFDHFKLEAAKTEAKDIVLTMGVKEKWAKEQVEFTSTKTAPGKWTNGSGRLDFAAAASSLMKKRKGG